MKNCIAERELSYSKSKSGNLRQLVIRIGKPYLLQEDMVEFQYAEGTTGCSVFYEGFENDFLDDVYGADSVQALELAVGSIEPTLRRFRNKYDFFFPSGEPYFDDQ